MEPAPPEKLLEAFRVLDPEDKGYVSKDNISKLMMEEGEPFTQEELDEMLATAVDQGSGNIPYEYYLNQLMVNLTNSFKQKITKLCLISTNQKIQFMSWQTRLKNPSQKPIQNGQPFSLVDQQLFKY